MPFDSLHAPPEWRSPRKREEPDRPLTKRDWVVVVFVAAALSVITLANCRMLVGYWHG